MNDELKRVEPSGDLSSVSFGESCLSDGLSLIAEAAVRCERLEHLLHELVEVVRNLVGEPVCLLHLLDNDRNGFAVKAFGLPEGQTVNTESLFIKSDGADVERLFELNDLIYLRDAVSGNLYSNVEVISRYGWKSMLATPLAVKDGARNTRIGILQVLSYPQHLEFTVRQRHQFKALGLHASIAIMTWRRLNRFLELSQMMREISEEGDIGKVFKAVLWNALRLAGASRGWISRLNPTTGLLDVRVHAGKPVATWLEKVGEGITGRCVEQGTPIVVDDVLSDEWRGLYRASWPETRSEMAVPIVSRARIRIGHKIRFAPKPLGVLNLESPTVGAFLEVDRDSVWTLARQAAIIIDKLELDQKLTKLAEVQKQLAGKRDWDELLRIVPYAIKILGYEYVNISLVDSQSKRIRTMFVTGIPEEGRAEFMRMADHALDSEDIQADIVRTARTEVSDGHDRRFDRDIWERLGHGEMIRLFVPITAPPGKRVIGTVEAGYGKGYRKFIYEQDVQLLRNFLDYAVLSLEPRTRRLLQLISHEFSSSVVGIKSNVAFLQKRFGQLDRDRINTKFDDLMLDCDVLQVQIEALHQAFGWTSTISKRERTVVFRDVVIKTIMQLRPVARVAGLDWQRIEYDKRDSHRIHLDVDRAKLNQVVYNVLTNSIKYAEPEAEHFRIAIGVNEDDALFIITFRDWGIGIDEKYAEKVFEEEFRAPEAIRKTVKGAGLGLPIARRIMRDMGGDLVLTGFRKPTEFQLLLPKSLSGGKE